MHKIDDFSLMCGANLPIKELGLVMTQPKIKAIAEVLGEADYFVAIACFTTRKEELDLSGLPEEISEKLTDYDCMMSAFKADPNRRIISQNFLQILFPDYEVFVDMDNYILKFNKGELEISVDNTNFSQLLFYIKKIFKLEAKEGESEAPKYASKRAEEIAAKLKQGKEKRAAMNENRDSILANEISSLATWLGKTIEEITSSMTMFQFYDQIQRTKALETYQSNYRAMLAGAQDIELENWRGKLK